MKPRYWNFNYLCSTFFFTDDLLPYRYGTVLYLKVLNPSRILEQLKQYIAIKVVLILGRIGKTKEGFAPGAEVMGRIYQTG